MSVSGQSAAGSTELPEAARPRDGEILIGRWHFPVPLRHPVVASTDNDFILTSHRLVVLSHPRLRPVARLVRFTAGRQNRFLNDMNSKWHVLLDSPLRGLAEPSLGEVNAEATSTLSSHRALIVGEKHFWVGDAPEAAGMVAQVRAAWEKAQRLPDE